MSGLSKSIPGLIAPVSCKISLFDDDDVMVTDTYSYQCWTDYSRADLAEAIVDALYNMEQDIYSLLLSRIDDDADRLAEAIAEHDDLDSALEQADLSESEVIMLAFVAYGNGNLDLAVEIASANKAGVFADTYKQAAERINEAVALTQENFGVLA
jgi:hypothetical protein